MRILCLRKTYINTFFFYMEMTYIIEKIKKKKK